MKLRGSALVLLICLLVTFTCGRQAEPKRPLPPAPVSVPGEWKLAFDDDFNGTTLDARRWSACYQYLCTNRGSQELTWYQAANLREHAGQLSIKVLRQQIAGTDGRQYPFTSGMVSSYSSFRFKYGFMEARLRCASGKGLWPAFWATPADDSWPPEVDALEALGDRPNEVAMTYHWPATAPSTRPGRSQSVVRVEQDIRQWHTYGVDIEPGALTWYLDGKVRKRITDPGLLQHLGPELYLIVNLAIAPGANAPGPGDSFPKQMDVDYVRAWRP